MYRIRPHHRSLPLALRSLSLRSSSHIVRAKTYTGLLDDIEKGNVFSASISQNQQKITVIDKDGNTEEVRLPQRNNVVETLVDHNVPLTIEPTGLHVSPVDAFLLFIQLFFATIVIRSLFTSSRSPSNPLSFGKSNTKNVNEKGERVQTKFDDVAGIPVAKHDLQEIVDFLKNPAKYTKLGAKVPKGVLLVGPPGTGKTLLARAVAGEANVPFFSASGSEFIEMFVGIGASRIRDLFEKAAKNTPSIIFIDEIDAIGKARGNSMGFGGNDERDNTINQLLTAMDGFETNSGVIVLAATNRAELLDPALLRPGRFDRKVQVDLPDFKGRLDILRVHTSDKPLDPENPELLTSVAKNTIGFSGADLANLANESAILAARRDYPHITLDQFNESLEKMVLGQERPTIVLSQEKKKILAYHEAGHALVGSLLGNYDRVRKITIVPRGSAGGVTYFEPNEDRQDVNLVTREHLEHQIMVALGGRVAEEIIFGPDQVTTGASGDLQAVEDIAYQMVSMYGFNADLGPIAWGNSEIDVSSDIAIEMKHIVDQCLQHTKELLVENKHKLHSIANALLEKETLDHSDLQAIL